jgi:hypothetical protein
VTPLALLPRLIGITGKAGAGKDTLADLLVEKYGFEKYSLASPIKKLLNERFGWKDEFWQDRAWKEAESEQCGFKAARLYDYFSPRSWAQWLGTEVGRTVGGEDVWANMMAKAWLNRHVNVYDTPRMVVPDVRFDNEASRIIGLGGFVVQVHRDDIVPVAQHPSENGVNILKIKRVLVNNGTPEQLLEQFEAVKWY